MKCDAGRGSEAVEPVLDQLGIPLAQPRHAERDFPDEIRPSRNIKRTTSQCLVHRRVGRSVTGDPALVAECLQHRLANGDAGVFGGMMLVDMEIADSFDLQVDE